MQNLLNNIYSIDNIINYCHSSISYIICNYLNLWKERSKIRRNQKTRTNE